MANFCTGIKECGVPIEDKYLLKETLIENYPELLPQFKSSTLWGWGGCAIRRGDYNGVVYYRCSPVQTIAGGNDWKMASASNYESGAIKNDGTLWMWGGNISGTAGNNTTVRISSPVQTISGGTNWKLLCVGSKAGAIKTDGTLWMWGNNAWGNLGDNTIAGKSSPVQTVAGGTDWKSVHIGSFYEGSELGVKNDGTLWVWGRNRDGSLGNFSTVHVSSPSQIISGGTNWKCAQNSYRISGGLKTDGTLWMWGSNSLGGFGDLSFLSAASSPVQTVSSTTDWKTHSVGYIGAVSAIKNDGTLWLWGNIYSNGATALNERFLSSPTQIINGGSNWKKIVSYSGGIAMKSDGTLWGWGDNRSNQLGSGDFAVFAACPVQLFAGTCGIKDFTWARFGGFFIKEEGDF